jgi:hypothetical protein
MGLLTVTATAYPSNQQLLVVKARVDARIIG